MSQLTLPESVPDHVRAFLTTVASLSPDARPRIKGSYTRRNGSATGGVSFEAELVALRYSESLRLDPQNFEATRGGIVAGVGAARANQLPFLTVRGGEFGGGGSDEIRTISNLELVVDPNVLSGALGSNAALAAELSWLWELFRLVLRLNVSAEKTVGETVEQLGALSRPAETSGGGATKASAPAAPAGIVSDPLSADADADDFKVDLDEPEAAEAPKLDPLAALDDAQRGHVDAIRGRLDAMDIKTERLRGDELRAALAFQSAGGVFTRTTKGREDKTVVSEVRVGMDGKIQPVAKPVTGILSKPRSAHFAKGKGDKDKK